MAKDETDKSDKTGDEREEHLNRHFEIIQQVSPVKIIREQDRRIQSASSLSVVLACALFVSVGCLVFQAMSAGEYIPIAQDIRTGSFTELVPIAQENKINVQPGRFPHLNEEADTKRVENELAERRRLLSLFEPRLATEPEAAVSTSAASAPASAAKPASAPQATASAVAG